MVMEVQVATTLDSRITANFAPQCLHQYKSYSLINICQGIVITKFLVPVRPQVVAYEVAMPCPYTQLFNHGEGMGRCNTSYALLNKCQAFINPLNSL